jgi:hypothetical protein
MDHAAESPPAQPAPAQLPWDFHPALTEDRLRICGRMLANARRDALAMASYELGDDPWSVGCRAFAFGRHRLKRAAQSGEYPWLEVLDDSAHFVFVIGSNGQGVPVRFYRGAADEPTERTLRRQEMEVQQLSLALGEAAAEQLAFQLAVETGGNGLVERVVFLVLRGEDRVECFWPIPLELPVGAGAAVQLRLMADDSCAGAGEAARRSRPLPTPLPRRQAASGPQEPEAKLL